MAYRMLIAFVGVAAAMLASTESFARAGAAGHAGFASAHAMARPGIAHARHFRRGRGGTFWPGYDDDSFSGATQPPVEAAPPASNDAHTTITYDVPWDWAHRYPPAVSPSDRPYVPGCPTEAVKVPGRNGSEQTVNVTRCY
jgi:hypothetical protein